MDWGPRDDPDRESGQGVPRRGTLIMIMTMMHVDRTELGRDLLHAHLHIVAIDLLCEHFMAV